MSKICRYLTMYYIDDTIQIHKCFDIASSPPSPDEPFSPVWPSKIMATYHQYRLPPLSQQDISILNQKHETRIVEINDIREKTK